MRCLLLRAYLHLIEFDWVLARGDFKRLYRTVSSFPLASGKPGCGDTERVCAAIDTACVWYGKEVLCLQRSAATTCLLRRCGIPAQMVLGAQQIPFKAHAWVEVAGKVVNDRSYVAQMYAVLDRC